MAGIKTYQIKINGIEESIDSIKALERQLFQLEERIKALEAKSINIKGSSSTGGGGSSRTSNASSLSEEEKLEKQILQVEAKRKAYSKEIYQNYLAAKEQLKETENDQKQIAAAERLQANTYSNTMRGLKAELADLKEVIQTTDLASGDFQRMSDRILEITNRLKELEQAQGTFSRDVGHYEKAVQGFGRIKVAVGEVVREYDNYRKAMKELKQERFELANTVGKEAKEYKDVDIAIKKLSSEYKDLDRSSAFMDNLLDSMKTLTAFAQIGVGIQNLFDIDDKKYQESMTRMMALMSVINGIEIIHQQWKADDSWIMKPFKYLSAGIDDLGKKVNNFFTKDIIKNYEDVQKRLAKLKDEMANNLANIPETPQNKLLRDANAYNLPILEKTLVELDKKIATTRKNIKLLGTALKWVGNIIKITFTAGLVLILPELIEGITNFVKGLNSTKIAAEQAAKEMNAFNRQLEARKELLTSAYLRKAIDDEQFLCETYDMESDALVKQIEMLRLRAKTMEDTGVWGLYKATQNTEFTGKKLDMPATVGTGKFSFGGLFGNDLEITINDTKELEKAWKNCNEAIKNGKDYLSQWASGYDKYIGGIFVTVKDTEEAMRGLGNIRLSDFISDFQEVNIAFNKGQMSVDEYAKKLAQMRKEMNSNEILNSVVANLDKYIPDEGVRTAVQNIINELYRLDDAFNMTSAEQVHHWNQVRIDGMKEGSAKIKAQIDENERYEIEQTAHTEEQVKMVKEKYARQRENQLKSYYKSQSSLSKEHQKKLNDAEDELMKLRIENMANGYAKQLALLKKEEDDRLRKAKQNGIKVGETQAEIRKLYHKKQLELDRQWAYDTEKVYEDLYSTIVTIQRNAMNTEVGTAQQNVNRQKDQDVNGIGYFYANYDDTVRNAKSMYDEILAVEIAASKKQAETREDQLFKEKQFTDREENLRHKRMADEKAVSMVMEELAKHEGEITDEEWKKIHDSMKNSLAQMNGEIVQKFNERTINIKQFFKLIEDEQNAHTANMNAIQKKYDSDIKQSEADATKEQREAVNKRYSKIISAINKNEEKISRIRQKAIVRDTQGWGIVDIKKTNENYKKIIEGYKSDIKQLVQLKKELKGQLDREEITAEDYFGQVANIDSQIEKIKASLKEASDAAKNTIGEFIGSINQYVQAIGSSLQQLMSSLWNAQDNQFDKEQDAIDKQNEALEKALDKQEEIIDRHKQNVDSIEDELQTARGARREHLIDQLNAEVIAERRAAAEKKKIEKEQEALKKKQDELDKKRQQAQYQRELTSILVSGALATINAYATKPFVPVGLAMGSLSLGIVAAQYAIAKANPPRFKDGGVIQGNSHANGGVKVLGGRAEVEGGEFITNKYTTAQNIEILDYINSKKRRLDISDFIDFYSSDKPRSVIKNMSPMTRFETGGVVPTLRTDIDINDRLIESFDRYSNRPVVVDVREITSKQDNITKVKTLAGLTD